MNSKGFTLIELMMVVAVAGVMAMIGGSYMLDQKLVLKMKARELKSFLALARSEAVTRNSACVVRAVGPAEMHTAAEIIQDPSLAGLDIGIIRINDVWDYTTNQNDPNYPICINAWYPDVLCQVEPGPGVTETRCFNFKTSDRFFLMTQKDMDRDDVPRPYVIMERGPIKFEEDTDIDVDFDGNDAGIGGTIFLPNGTACVSGSIDEFMIHLKEWKKGTPSKWVNRYGPLSVQVNMMGSVKVIKWDVYDPGWVDGSTRY